MHYLRSMRLCVADVNKVLTSAADICLGTEMSYVEGLSTSVKINLRQQDRVYMHELVVMP